MVRYLLIFFCGMILLSCASEPLKTKISDLSEADIDGCQEVACPEITISYVTVEGDSELVTPINLELQQSVIEVLYLGDGNEVPEANTIIEAIDGFIKEYRLENAEFPGMAAEYFAQVDQETSLSSSALLSIEQRLSMYTGGAHGYAAVKFMNFDRNTGVMLNNEELFEDPAKALQICEEHFRREYKISPAESINSTGFWFENDVFALPETIGFTSKHLILHYNAYDIASYAEGPITLKIAIKELTSQLSFALE